MRYLRGLCLLRKSQFNRKIYLNGTRLSSDSNNDQKKDTSPVKRRKIIKTQLYEIKLSKPVVEEPKYINILKNLELVKNMNPDADSSKIQDTVVKNSGETEYLLDLKIEDKGLEADQNSQMLIQKAKSENELKNETEEIKLLLDHKTDELDFISSLPIQNESQQKVMKAKPIGANYSDPMNEKVGPSVETESLASKPVQAAQLLGENIDMKQVLGILKYMNVKKTETSANDIIKAVKTLKKPKINDNETKQNEMAEILEKAEIDVTKNLEKIDSTSYKYHVPQATLSRVKMRSTIKEEVKDEKANYFRRHTLKKPATQSRIFINFKPLDVQPEESAIWKKYRELGTKHLNETMPLNGFLEDIKLTDEGKLWHFPINNEQGVTDEDINEPFYEHVLLDDQLESFPENDVVRNFMKLVLNGLSQNAYLSVKEKKEAIGWYKNYFFDKLDDINKAIEAEKLELESSKS